MESVSLEASAAILKKFCKENENNSMPFDWLRGRSVSEAFVICLGAGPWKFGRRKNIQGQALEKLNGRDISEISIEEAREFYPLEWQNNFLLIAARALREYNMTFDKYCQEAMEDPEFALAYIRSLVATKEAKVISLFCRDGLGAPSFPIDRHVKRKLQELNLPTDEDSMIEVCEKAGIDPRIAAVTFVRTASDMDNPDWSVNDH